jgi:hypothetical protein
MIMMELWTILVTLGLGEVSRIRLWHDIGPFIGSEETFRDVCGRQFDTSRVAAVEDVFQKLSDLTFFSIRTKCVLSARVRS